jgi:hypothetical protein
MILISCRMAHHRLPPAPGTVHGILSRDFAPALSITPGDIVDFQTLAVGWGVLEQEPGFVVPRSFTPA